MYPATAETDRNSARGHRGPAERRPQAVHLRVRRQRAGRYGRYGVAVVSSRATVTSKSYKGVSRRVTARDCAASDAPPSSLQRLVQRVGAEVADHGVAALRHVRPRLRLRRVRDLQDARLACFAGRHLGGHPVADGHHLARARVEIVTNDVGLGRLGVNLLGLLGQDRTVPLAEPGSRVK